MTQSLIASIQNPYSKVFKIKNQIGNTPLYEINKVFHKPGVRIFAKLEWKQLGGSVKSRPAYNIIKNAIQIGKLGTGKHLLDATSGNTGIAYAAIGAKLNIPITLCLPENASEERKRILKSLGVNLILTSRFESTDGAQLRAKELSTKFPDRYFYADQYANENNWKAHFETTAPEIWAQTNQNITHFVAGLGTTGTFTGTGRGLKNFDQAIKLIALQPNNPMHGLEGWKHLETAIVPKIYDDHLADRILEIDTLESFAFLKSVFEKEKMLLSPSAAANLLGAIKVAQSIDSGTIVTTFADNSEKYGEVIEHIFN